MTALQRRFPTLVRRCKRLVYQGRRRWLAFAALWRRSLQLRVVVSTLALSSAVVFVLGIVLQTQVTDRLMNAKEAAAIAQAFRSADVVQRELLAIDPASTEAISARLAGALAKLTSPNLERDVANPAAGAFEPVLVDGAATPVTPGARPAYAGPYNDVPVQLRNDVQQDKKATQIVTVTRDSGKVTLLVVGLPVASAGRALQLYLLFPLTAEQRTVGVVQSTLGIGGLVLLFLLAGITNLVTRQVVRPVRHAAEVAERFADGKLDERMDVVGEDDVARLADSFNEMAASLQRQIQQLEEFGQLQRRFTSDVSHELRTPLTTVRMAADVLHASREQFPQGLARSTELLVAELDRFEALLADLLEISRLDAGVADLSVDAMDVRSIVQRAVDSVRVISGKAGVPVELYLPETEVTAEVDARRLERILRNLLANAIDHGEGRPVQLQLAADRHAVAFTVRDFGVGLRPGEAELVFTRFWRADPSRDRQTGGTGLGLSISIEDAHLHGGRLDAWGELGEGACFRLTLPRIQDVELHSGSPLPLPPPIPNAGRPPAAVAVTAGPGGDEDQRE
ncbi:MtrAB system histidine kinase MtrB [Crossiella cryophila]|uniref:Sensor histidine kinase MtrB n=1 Tax=Crossiella cryophila TaxID=43355 RepID=A0A7W7FSE3_9PSEU|nr:two-component system sensor histidine kinase MtrB [Crossiella cryophila]